MLTQLTACRLWMVVRVPTRSAAGVLAASAVVACLAACAPATGSVPPLSGQRTAPSVSTPATAAAHWRLVAIDGPPPGTNGFDSIAAARPDSAWAAGQLPGGHNPVRGHELEHWNGHRWTVYALPRAIDPSWGPPVVAAGPGGAWLFGYSAQGELLAMRVAGGLSQLMHVPGRDVEIVSAVVASPRSVWLFGQAGGLFPTGGFAAHFNGHAWTTVAVPMFPVSSSGTPGGSVWIYGQTAKPKSANPGVIEAARWTGRGWRRLRLPSLRLPADKLATPQSVLALSNDDVFVDAAIGRTVNYFGSVAVLHWSHGRWSVVNVPGRPSWFDPDMTSDGRGGFWLTGLGPSSSRDRRQYFYHYLDGRWSRQLPETGRWLMGSISALANVPGTTSVWAAGGVANPRLPSTNGKRWNGGVFRYGPA